MHTITDHKVNGLNEAINIVAVDEPGPGGANHRYDLRLIGPSPVGGIDTGSVFIDFQNGPIKEAGYNGLSNEALLAVLIDRMRGFQYGRTPDGAFNTRCPGTYACKENACALTHMEEALMWLQKRTRDRMARGVEGTHQK
jgi:hypothetical protein